MGTQKPSVMENTNLVFLLNKNIWCGYSKEPSQYDGSFEQPKHMIQLTGKEIITTLHFATKKPYLGLCGVISNNVSF